MKIYDYADLGGKRSWDYEDGRTPEDDGVRPIMITDKEINIGEPLIIDGTAYCVCCVSAKRMKRQYAYVERLKEQKVFTEDEEPEERYYTRNIVCPFCGNEIEGFEMNDYEDEYECECCGSVFSYEREVTVEYYSKPVKKSEPVVLN